MPLSADRRAAELPRESVVTAPRNWIAFQGNDVATLRSNLPSVEIGWMPLIEKEWAKWDALLRS
jgi:hypothetical protein